MRIIPFLLVCLLAGGCATTAKYDAKLNSMIGVSEETLVSLWGVPDKQYRMSDGKKAVEYVSKETVRTGGYLYQQPQVSYHSGTINGKPYQGTSTEYVTEVAPVQKYKLSCKTSFVIDENGKVVSWHHEGNNCVSR